MSRTYTFRGVSFLKRLGRGCMREAIHRLKLSFELRNVEIRNPILVYQMGKVGSSTVVAALKRLEVTEPTLQIHTLSHENLVHAISRQRNSPTPFLSEHLVASLLLRKRLDHAIFPCRIVTLAREPISRAISFVFGDLIKQAPHAYLPGGKLDTEVIKATLDDLLGVPNGVTDPTIWFNRELKACFGIDVFSQPYDLERGYTIFSTESITVLVIRMEDINRALGSALADVLNIDPTLVANSNCNVGTRKWYADDLAHVQSTYRVAPNIADNVLATKYFQHFYAADADKIRARWVGKRCISNT